MIISFLVALAVSQQPPILHGDFDRDGQEDVVRAVTVQDGRRFLLVELAADKSRPHVLTTFSASDRLTWSLAPQGNYRLACAKGHGRSSDRCSRRRLAVRQDALMFGTEESAQAIANWNGNSFDVFWTSD